MLNTIAKLKTIIDTDLQKLKSIQLILNEVQSLIKKNEYMLAQKIIKSKLRKITAEKYPNSISLLDEINNKIDDQIRKFKIDFNESLISLCEDSGLTPISGNSRKGYKIKGIIEVTIDFEKNMSTIGTYCKKNKVNSVKQQDIIREINRENKRLFERKLAEKDFLSDLYESYLELSKRSLDKEVLLRDIQTKLWLKIQNDRFWKSFDKDHLNNYPTDEFSVDLSKLLKSKIQISNDIQYVLLEGASGITVYDNSGNFRSFKFITFKKRGNI